MPEAQTYNDRTPSAPSYQPHAEWAVMEQAEAEATDIPAGREPISLMLRRVLVNTESILLQQDHAKQNAAEHHDDMTASFRQQKEQYEDLLEETKALRQFVSSLSLRARYTRLSLVSMAISTLVLVGTLLSGGEMVLSTRFATTIVIATIVMYAIAVAIPENNTGTGQANG